jgi:hypothetical protein
MLSYTGCTLPELRQYNAVRKLAAGPIKALSRNEIVAQLELADETPPFDRFFDMPPELRNRVYAHYSQWLGALSPAFCQPPLRLALRVLCGELLPVFFANATLQVRVAMRRCDQTSKEVPFKGVTIGLSRHAAQSIPEGLLARILRLQIIYESVIWNLDLHGGISVEARSTQWFNHAESGALSLATREFARLVRTI